MSDRFVRIVGLGLIGINRENGPYRQVVFQEENGIAKAELLVNKKERPLLWDDIEKLEKGGKIPPYRGYITQLNNIALVVFEDESIEDAFARQKQQLNIKAKLSYAEAELMREKSVGYITNLSIEGAMDIGWKPIDKSAEIIKFRAYTGNGKFVWGNWHEIIRG